MAHVGLEPSTQRSNPVYGGGTEAQYMQDVVERLKVLLEAAGHRCSVFAGESDANSDGARALVYARPRIDLALSIHSDAGYDIASHWAALCCKQEERSRPWYTTVMECYCASMKFDGVPRYTNRGYQQRTPGVNGVAVIRIPESVGIPTCLIETNWHDRNPDAAAERAGDWRQRCAESLARGVLTYLGQAGPMPDMSRKEEATMYCPTFVLPMQGSFYAWSIPDVFNSLPQFQAVFPGLTLHNPTDKPVTVHVWVTRDNGTISLEKDPVPELDGATFSVELPRWSRKWVELSQYISRDKYVGGASLTIKAPIQITAVAASLAKWK